MGWFEIAGVHDYRTALIEQSTLVFDTRNLLDFVPVFVEAREVSARSRRRVVDIVKGRMRDQDGDQRRAIQHGESHAAYRLPRRTGAVRNSPCALLACPRLRGNACQASSDRVNPRAFAPQEGLPLALEG